MSRNKALFRMRGKRGIAVLLTSLMMLILMPIVGLSIDAGYAFLIKTRLSAAMDSAALAAGRGLNLAQTVAQAQTQATAQATAFFNANFPVGYLNTDPVVRSLTHTFTLQTDVNGNPNGVLTISVTGTVRMPTYFMKWLGFNNLDVAATGTATRRNLVMELVLDTSSSMGTRNTSPGTIPTSITASSSSCEAMVYSAIQFLQYFSPYDTVGMVSFDYTAYNRYPPSTNFKRAGAAGATQAIANLQCGNNTNTTAGMELAYNEILGVNQQLAQNVIVLFTDGVPNGVNANFPIRTQVDTRYGPSAYTPAPPDVPAGNRANCRNTGGGIGTLICQDMPVCTTTAGFVKGVLVQWAGFSYNSGDKRGLYKMFSTDSATSLPGHNCKNSSGNTIGNTDSSVASQFLAYIPDTDWFGNSTHGPWDPPDWLYAVNNHCAPVGTPMRAGNDRCHDLGDLWSNYPALGAGAPSNSFPSGPYQGKLRPDLANTIGVASMNTVFNEANKIRSNTSFNITIDTIYLQGNGSDPVDRMFLQAVANTEMIQPIIYDSGAPAYANPYHQSNQQKGMWLATTSTLELNRLFAEVASSLLRISQ